MWIESVKRLRVQFKDHGVYLLRPGHPIELPDADGQRLLACAPEKVKVVEAPTVSVLPLDPRVGSVVQWGLERGLVRLVLLDHDVRWAWVETATRAGWTTANQADARCWRCRGTRWWWSTAAVIPCGFSHNWIARKDPETGEDKGPGHPADRDHLNECCAHRFRFHSSLAILCGTCHPPRPSHADWSAAWREIAELGAHDPTVVDLVQACDAAFLTGDYVDFLRQQARLTAFIGHAIGCRYPEVTG